MSEPGIELGKAKCLQDSEFAASKFDLAHHNEKSTSHTGTSLGADSLLCWRAP